MNISNHLNTHPQSPLFQRSSSIQRLAQSFLLGTCVSVVGVASHVNAAETVILQFQESQVKVPISNFQTFAKTGEAQTQNVRDFFQRHPRAGEIVRSVLTKEITINTDFATQNFQSPLGEFLVTQLNSILGIANEQLSVRPMYTALVSAFKDDNRISLLEVIEAYPKDTIQINLMSVQNTYEKVRAFVEQTQPKLTATKESIKQFVCRCPTTSLAPSEPSGSNLLNSSTPFLSSNSVCAIQTP